MRRFLKENGLSIVFLLLFLGALAGQALAGHADYNDQQAEHGDAGVSLARHLVSADFGVSVIRELPRARDGHDLVGDLVRAVHNRADRVQRRPAPALPGRRKVAALRGLSRLLARTLRNWQSESSSSWAPWRSCRSTCDARFAGVEARGCAARFHGHRGLTRPAPVAHVW